MSTNCTFLLMLFTSYNTHILFVMPKTLNLPSHTLTFKLSESFNQNLSLSLSLFHITFLTIYLSLPNGNSYSQSFSHSNTLSPSHTLFFLSLTRINTEPPRHSASLFLYKPILLALSLSHTRSHTLSLSLFL